MVTFATDLYDPKLLGTKTVTDLNGGDVVAGDQLEYVVPVQNIGLDTAYTSDFFDAIPTGTTYVPGSLSVDGTGLTDADGDDTGSYVDDGHQGHLLVHVGSGATSTTGGSVPADNGSTVYSVRFRVTVDSAATDGQQLVNAADLSYRGLTTRAASASATNAVMSPVVAGNSGANRAPTAAPHVIVFSPTPTGRTAVIPVLDGSSDPDGDPLTVVGATDGAGGPVTINPDGTVTYRPADGFAGRDVFSYTISDGHGGTSTATVQIDVTDDAPTAVDDSGTTPYGTRLVVDVLRNDTDSNGDPLAVRSVGPTAHGGAVTVLSDGTVAYVPPTGYRGADTFDDVVEDSRGLTDTGTVTITVTNTAPVAVADSYTTQPGDARKLALLGNDSDADGDPITAELVTGPAHGALLLDGDGAGSYTPAAGFVGTDSFTYRISDGQGGTSSPVTVTILVNAAPTAVDDDASTPTGNPVDVAVLGNDADTDGGQLTVTSATAGSHGSTLVNSGGTVTYSPAAGFAGSDTFTYDVSDGQGGTGTAATHVDVLANDTDANIPGTSQTLSVTSATADQGAAVTVEPDGTLTVVPTGGFKGVVTVTYAVSDGADGQASGTLLVTVGNAGPVAAPDGPVHTATGSPLVVDVLANDTDANGDALTIAADSLTAPTDSGGTTRGTVAVRDGQVRFTPAAGYAGTVTFTYRATDGTDSATATLTVVVDNAPPVAADDSARTATGVPVTVAVLANDTDPNIPGTSQSLSVLTATADSGATVTRNPSGTLTVTPSATWKGLVTVTYQVSDGAGGSATGSLLVTVADAAPVASPDAATTPYATPVTVDLLANDADENGDQISVVGGSLSAPVDASGTVRGAVSVVDGVASYTPPVGFSGTVTFTYRATDGELVTTGTATVVVGDAPPVATPNTGSTTSGRAVTIDVLGDDSDPDGGQLTLVSVTQPQHGTATIVDGHLVYTAAGDYTGSDTFTYTVSDGQGGTSTASVRVDVTAATRTADGTGNGSGTGPGTTSGTGPGTSGGTVTGTDQLTPTSVPAGSGGQAEGRRPGTDVPYAVGAGGLLALSAGLVLLALRRRPDAL